MAQQAAFKIPDGGGIRGWIGYAIGAALLLALIGFLYNAFTAVEGVRVDTAPPTPITMLPPPPPPPPPPPEPQEKPPEPTETPAPTPEPAAPKPDAPAPMQIDGPAQAGADAFGIGAGKGGGIGAPGGAGTCLGPNCGKPAGGGRMDAFYHRNLSQALQRAISRDSRVNRLVFTADFEIVVTPAGEIRAAKLRRSSGKSDRDAMLKAILEAARGLPQPPNVTSRYPVLITVRGRNSLGG